MARVTKGMIKAANSNLAAIREIATDPQVYGGSGAAYQYHAQSANNSLAVLKSASQPLPEWLSTTGEKYLRAMGWRW